MMNREYQPKAEPLTPFSKNNDEATTFYKLISHCDINNYVETPKHAPLTQKIARNGNPIFPAGFEFSKYVLLVEKREFDKSNPFKFKISEIYGYAPEKLYEKSSYEQIRRWGWKDPDYLTKGSIKIGEGAANKRYLGYESNSQIELTSEAEAEKFETGDTIYAHIASHFIYLAGAGNPVVGYTWVESGYYTIRGIIGNKIITNQIVDLKTMSIDGYTPAPYSSTHDACYIYDFGIFWSMMNGKGALPSDREYTLRPTIGGEHYIAKAYKQRTAKTDFVATFDKISYHLEFPELERAFVPQNQIGTEFTTIDQYTIPTISEWKARCASNGEDGYFLAQNPRVQYLPDLGLWEMTRKYAKCVL